ncbi:MAG: hypothetical protein ACK4S2_07120 [Gemmobacter sp.]|uniref:hypothetical protein n=1 Tax=Gemmobacter sp. TaxID=1898957 RepID=UPI00391952DE
MLTSNTDLMRAEIARHIEADAVRGGHYWNGRTGCFIGCLAHSSDATELGRRYGLPLPLVRICEDIFKRLPQAERPVFFREVGEAVGGDGRDLTRVHWLFLADTLRHLPDTAARDVVAQVIDGMEKLARGEDWIEAEAWAHEADAAGAAADAAWAAARAAWAAADAARAADAAWAAAWVAARAAWEADAETQRQRAAMLRIIKEA